MKKVMLVASILLMILLYQGNYAFSSDRELSVVGKILMGSGRIIRDISDDDHYYYRGHRCHSRCYHHRRPYRRYNRRPVVIIKSYEIDCHGYNYRYNDYYDYGYSRW